LDSKVTRDEGSRIWGNFSRFALYDDLKELYNRCMPAISGFQDELSDSVTEMTKLKTIIRRFDENLSDKVNKHMMLEF
jgi:hypothetical protein